MGGERKERGRVWSSLNLVIQEKNVASFGCRKTKIWSLVRVVAKFDDTSVGHILDQHS